MAVPRLGGLPRHGPPRAPRDPRRRAAARDRLLCGALRLDDPASPLEDCWLVSATDEGEPGIDDAITRRRSERPALGASIVGMVTTVQVRDLDAALAKADELGDDVALARQEVRRVGSVAYVHATEANVVGLFEALA
jgi:predicted enzyme related to lactoylglutathione lyase